jgi:subtilase family serine protease
LWLLVPGLAIAQYANPASSIIVPNSSIALRAEAGIRAHTNVQAIVPAAGPRAAATIPGPPFPGFLYQTPASIACIYGFVPVAAGCNPNLVTTNPVGGSKAIAIVDAYDDPNAVSDLATFSAQFGLPAANLTVVYASGARPPQDPTGGWELEESVDIEWAHAMAPSAHIYLVEANSNFFYDLYPAVQLASGLVAGAGGGEVSMSWGSMEFQGENSFDSFFTTPTVVYFASAGDSAGVEYPSASPHVVSAGGTTLSMNLISGFFQQEQAWEYTGGGPSRFETTPIFQSLVSGLNGARGTPDMAFDSDLISGVWVDDSTPVNGLGGPSSPWWIVGGTSVASPSLAGVVNTAGHFFGSTTAELTTVYSLSFLGFFRDVTAGVCGPFAGYQAKAGYDFCTGLGSPHGYNGK